MSFDVALATRRVRPQRSASPLRRRADADLPFVTGEHEAGPELLLDTSVYIDVLQGRTPPEVDRLLTIRILNHSAVALAELTHLFGRLDPAHPNTRAALGDLRATVEGIPAHRLSAPSLRAFGEAGMLAGLAARLTGSGHGVALLNDALLLLHAAESGCVLMTGNINDFDLLQQLVPHAQILIYRKI